MARAPTLRLRAGGRTFELGGRPWLMGIVNASPDSFSDAGRHRTLEDRVALAAELLEAGADVIDIGGESGVTGMPAVAAADEIARVVPLIKRVAGELGALVSVDTYKPLVARAAVAAGATIVNDVSGLREPSLADVCARSGAGLVLMHTRAAPKEKLLDQAFDGRVASDVDRFLRERIAAALERGVAFEQLILDPGPDFGKTPAQTVEVLRALPALHALGRPVLLAVSRKDFVGAITGRPPRARMAGTLAAIGHGVDAGAHILRVHDVADVADFLAVRAALAGEAQVDPALRLAGELRREPSGRGSDEERGGGSREERSGGSREERGGGSREERGGDSRDGRGGAPRDERRAAPR
ncbi:MAG: dihydropteroate synthase [Solirubrobacterales bacterium]|nr:dihydropteroate synthase [Solirubrobacterales bacterium]